MQVVYICAALYKIWTGMPVSHGPSGQLGFLLCVDLTTLELLRRDVKVASNGKFSIAVSAIVTEMQVWCFHLAKMCGGNRSCCGSCCGWFVAAAVWGSFKKVAEWHNHKICMSYFVTYQHNLLQLKRTWSRVSPTLCFHCRRIVDLALPASHLLHR